MTFNIENGDLHELIQKPIENSSAPCPAKKNSTHLSKNKKTYLCQKWQKPIENIALLSKNKQTYRTLKWFEVSGDLSYD